MADSVEQATATRTVLASNLGFSGSVGQKIWSLFQLLTDGKKIEDLLTFVCSSLKNFSLTFSKFKPLLWDQCPG